MTRPRVRLQVWAVLAVTLFLASSFAVASAHLGPLTAAAPTATAASLPVTPAPWTSDASSPTGGVHPGPMTVASIRAALAKEGVPMRDVHLPALAKEGDRRGQPVQPTYSAAPAPMGVADIGLRNVGGNLVGYVLNTSSAEGSITLTNAQSVYVDGDGPDMYGVQLNSVVTNVTLFGNSTYQFWTQNFVSYTSSSGELAFGDNVWNFSDLSGLMSSNVFYAHGPNGSLFAPVYYYATGPTFTIHYPFTVTFYLNATILSDRPAVFFNYTLSNATMTQSGSFDYVIFNSSYGTPRAPAPLAMFQVNGEQYDPIGLINDIELSVLGNDNGDTTTFYQISATATISYWNATTRSYWPVPSAVNAGADTGETSDGVDSYYLGTSAVAHLALGPSFLTGLWNTTTPPGVRAMALTLVPAAALILVNPGAARNASAAQWVPSSPTGTTTFYFANTGRWFFDILLSEYTPGSTAVMNNNHNGTFTVTVNLGPRNPAVGIYAPMIAWGNAELATFAASGAGTALSPYVLYDNEGGPLYPEFTQWNDFEFPVFPGLLLIQTSAYVDVTPAPFTVNYPPWMSAELFRYGLPTTNNLQSEFWNVSHVAVLNAPQISGWLSGFLLSFYPLGDVIFWNSSGNLVAGDTFYDQGAALALYGGNANTVWGNTFLSTGTSATNPYDVLGSPSNQTGIWESEAGDLVYNNYFSVPAPAFTPTFDPLSCQISCVGASYPDRWNVSYELASASQTVLGITLTGSIIGTTYQGGSYWSNYGTPSNPYGVLPYTDSGLITPGGDYVPLVPFSLYHVTFNETGLPSGTAWGVSTPDATVNSTATSIGFEDPNGSYPFLVYPPASGYAPSPLNGSFSVNGGDVVVNISFRPLWVASFQESGLPAGFSWSVSLNGTGTGGVPSVESSTNSTIRFSEVAGHYTFVPASVGYTAVPATGVVVLNASAVMTNVTFQLYPQLTFTETGLPVGSGWSVALTQGGTTTNVSSNGTSLFFDVYNSVVGPYTFRVYAPGYLANPTAGSGSLPANSSQEVVFTLNHGSLELVISPACGRVGIDLAPFPLSSCVRYANFTLPVGSHSIEVVASGYLPYFNNVTMLANRTLVLNVSLVAQPGSSSAPAVGTLGWELVALLAVIALLLLGTTLVLLRRSRRPPGGTGAGPPQPWKEEGAENPPNEPPPS